MSCVSMKVSVLHFLKPHPGGALTERAGWPRPLPRLVQWVRFPPWVVVSVVNGMVPWGLTNLKLTPLRFLLVSLLA
jgi:hypothetical protein